MSESEGRANLGPNGEVTTDEAELTGDLDRAAGPEAGPARADATVLALEGIGAGYRQFRALFDVSLSVQENQAVALVGPNGAGKTTAARVASGLLAPSSGKVLSGGRDLTGRPAQEFALAGIAHAPEGRSIFSTLSVEENLALPFRRQFGRSGLRGALDKAYELFPRLGERRGQNAGSLSGGEQRMLTMARVLVYEPKLLIADEPSLGLAPIITGEVYDVLERILASGTSLLLIEQHVDRALAIADHMVVLEHGDVVLSGKPDEIDTESAFTLAQGGNI